MNKQALAFISMFTLVLMLSIYYVSLEPETETVHTPINDISTVMALLEEQNSDKKDSLVLQLKETLASSSVSEEKKKEILTQIEMIDGQKNLETKIKEQLSQHQIKGVICIEEDIVKVNIFEQEKTTEKADEIMRMIYPSLSKNQTIELVFS